VDEQTTARGPSTARWEAQCGPRNVSKMLKNWGFENHLCEHNKTFKNEGGIMERERRDENHVNARESHLASQHLTAWPSLPSLFIVSQSEQHVSASPVYYCLLRWLVRSKLAHLTFYFFHLARPQKSLPIPVLDSGCDCIPLLGWDLIKSARDISVQ
jgi:hypothetical protein